MRLLFAKFITRVDSLRIVNVFYQTVMLMRRKPLAALAKCLLANQFVDGDSYPCKEVHSVTVHSAKVASPIPINLYVKHIGVSHDLTG